ncbi:unnamed protein product [Dovyalis caffra]|uniref:Protein argonaute N-terminal domain-containing protein n=1 Tax=Dovyalis caffra TaxID=77055 RepID=A0AAV1S0F2_9ROSI|nr:unnamed protein product [Dovyalis caffra]
MAHHSGQHFPAIELWAAAYGTQNLIFQNHFHTLQAPKHLGGRRCLSYSTLLYSITPVLSPGINFLVPLNLEGGGRGQRGDSPAPIQGGGRGRGRGAPRPSPMASSEAGSSSSVSQLRNEMERLVVRTEPAASTRPAAVPAPQQRHQQQLVPASSAKFAQRPGYGTEGSRCLIRANHFLVELADRHLHHYDVSITPEVTSRGVNRAIMRELLAVNGTHFDNRIPAYDGRKGFYTAGPLPFTSQDFAVTLTKKDDQGSVR